jgi:hypothetical protein
MAWISAASAASSGLSADVAAPVGAAAAVFVVDLLDATAGALPAVVELHTAVAATGTEACAATHSTGLRCSLVVVVVAAAAVFAFVAMTEATPVASNWSRQAMQIA